MGPEDLARRHPRLFHVTGSEAVSGIMRHGLLSTEALLALFDVPELRRQALGCERRERSVVITHPAHGSARITDNSPLTTAGLTRCLDGGLQPADWMRLLNRRVFFWADEAGVGSLAQARLNRNRDLSVLIADTLSLVRAHFERIELSAINSGSTMRQPARRGPSTFTPVATHSYEAWRALRGGRDRIREVTVLGGIADISRHLVEVRALQRGG